MKGVDTNILLRSVTGDDARQSRVADRFLAESEATGEHLFVSTIALCELAWTLRGRPYSYSRAAIAKVIATLLEMGLFVVQDRDLVRVALREYEVGGADFPDLLLSLHGAAAGCTVTVTLDDSLGGRTGFEVLE